MAKNVSNLAKDINLQIQEVECIPYRRNPKKSRPGHILTKLLKTKMRNSLESGQREMMFYCRGHSSKDGRFLVRNHGGQKEGAPFSNAERRELPVTGPLLVKRSFRKGGEIKTLSDEGKLREFVTSRPETSEWKDHEMVKNNRLTSS